MKSHILILASVFVFACLKNNAQEIKPAKQKTHNNEFTLSIGSYKIPGYTETARELMLPGIGFTRRVYKNIHIELSYVQWENYDRYPHEEFRYGSWHNLKKGDILARGSYKMTDIIAKYKYAIKRNHVIYVGVGGSYIWGVNAIVEGKVLYAEPPFVHLEVFTAFKQANYVALTATLGYQYRFFKDMLGVGGSFKTRTIPNQEFTQYDMSFNASIFF